MKADFNIEMYDIDFTIDNKLKSLVKMEIGEQTKENSYQFTLYHGYKIKKVYDEKDNELEFSQNGDYFEVFKPNGENLDSIIVEYSGFSEAFYSNRQAVFLTGLFPYYPQAGYNKVFSLDEYRYVPNQNGASKFSVSVDSKMNLVSNLDGDGKNFDGVAQNLSLIGGYYEENTINGYDVIEYPLDHVSNDNLEIILSKAYQDKVEETKNILGETSNMIFSGKKIIVIPYTLDLNTLLRDVYIFDDYVLINILNITNDPYSVFSSFFPETVGKEYLRGRFLPLLLSNSEGREMLVFSEQFNDYSILAQVNDELVLKLEEFGVDYVAPIVYEYLKDESNTQDELEFLKSIK